MMANTGVTGHKEILPNTLS